MTSHDRRAESVRRRLPPPAMVIAIAALVLSLTGSAVAAKKYLITSKKQISPKVLKQLKGNRGAKGATGVTGTAGAQGPKGDTGAAGARGPSNAYTATLPTPGFVFSPAGTGLFTVGTLSNLPAGSYLLSAKANINNNDAAEQLVTCEIAAGAEKDEAWMGTGTGTVQDKRELALSLGHRFADTGSATLSCDNPGGGAGDLAVENVRITAIRVETLG